MSINLFLKKQTSQKYPSSPENFAPSQLSVPETQACDVQPEIDCPSSIEQMSRLVDVTISNLQDMLVEGREKRISDQDILDAIEDGVKSGDIPAFARRSIALRDGNDPLMPTELLADTPLDSSVRDDLKVRINQQDEVQVRSSMLQNRNILQLLYESGNVMLHPPESPKFSDEDIIPEMIRKIDVVRSSKAQN